MGMSEYSYQSLAAMGPQGRWRRVMLLTLIPMVLLFIYYSPPSSYMTNSLQSGSQYDLQLIHRPVGTNKEPSRFPHTQNVTIDQDDISMTAIIKALYGPILHPVDAANFTDEDGDVYRLHGEPKFKEKLGKRVLILDIDSRPLTGEGQLMNKELKWKSMRPLSAGMLSHYMFGTSCGILAWHPS